MPDGGKGIAYSTLVLPSMGREGELAQVAPEDEEGADEGEEEAVETWVVIVTVTLVPPASDLAFAARFRPPLEVVRGISTWKVSPLPSLLSCS
jgi:hypothetical protein